MADFGIRHLLSDFADISLHILSGCRQQCFRVGCREFPLAPAGLREPPPPHISSVCRQQCVWDGGVGRKPELLGEIVPKIEVRIDDPANISSPQLPSASVGFRGHPSHYISLVRRQQCPRGGGGLRNPNSLIRYAPKIEAPVDAYPNSSPPLASVSSRGLWATNRHIYCWVQTTIYAGAEPDAEDPAPTLRRIKAPGDARPNFSFRQLPSSSL